MIKNLMRGLTPLALILSPLAAPSPALSANVVLLPDALAGLTQAAEDPDGYKVSAFRHWDAGLDPADGCDTRAEVLLEEAIDTPRTGPGCVLTGGRWTSYYDGQSVTDPAALRVDHVVSLDEAWQSGASGWTAARREKYANDLGSPGTLAAVTARSQKDKAGRDPAGWLPSASTQYCRYVAEWVGTKLRWALSADKDEVEALKLLADGPCEETVVVRSKAPQ
ncbi:HNH endonuclease [Streptomyces sp. ISL-36]|uniref:HNH endonuclease family protein n=1 Tax=Streptomyces sp. ISL-36 TaxID=2819182 RepID=UPI001BE84959|nr:HNH endonuclease family protein [Streptomyces sp. ISL-36]MBT2443684.1 HNH endonuclease [Streptomyces sp. ISL-36]